MLFFANGYVHITNSKQRKHPVTDATGSILPGVTVEARDAAGSGQVTVTDGTGQFTFSGLAPGMYDVTFTLSGFASTLTSWRLRTGRRFRLPLCGSAGARAITLSNPSPFITTTASPELADIHHRQPAIIAPDRFDDWIDPTSPVPRLLDLVREPYGGPYEKRAVNTRVNSVRNDDPDILACPFHKLERVRLASCLQPGCLGRLHVGRFEDRRRLYSGV